MIYAGLLLTTLALAFFYSIDRFLLTSRWMSLIFRTLLLVNDFKTAWLALVVCLISAFWRKSSPVLHLVDMVAARPLGVIFVVTCAYGLGSVFIYHGAALSMDEYAAVFQSKIFAAGCVTGQFTPSVIDWLVPPGFNGQFLLASHSTGQVIEAYWPGFSLLLAPFEFLNAPWLCNALLSSLALLLIYRITLEISGDVRTGGWSLLFAIASGAFAANAISYYSMQAQFDCKSLVRVAVAAVKPAARVRRGSCRVRCSNPS